MPAVVAQMQPDIDRVLKRVDLNVIEFSNCWQRAKVDSSSGSIHSSQKLKKLSSALQQHRTQLQSLSTKTSSICKATKEKLEVARESIDNALDSFHAASEAVAATASGTNENEAAVGNIEIPAVGNIEIPETNFEKPPPVHKEGKVQWDQMKQETADDSSMLEEFICKICQVHIVGCGPKLARCSHLFCGDCIGTWFKVQPRSLSWAQRAQSGGLVPCPVCKEPLHEERDLFDVCATGQNESALLYRLLSGVKIVCANHHQCRADGKCTWTGEYGCYQKHLQTCANISLESETSPVAKPKEALAAKVLYTSSQGVLPPLDGLQDDAAPDLTSGQQGHSVPASWESLQPSAQQKPIEPAPTAAARRALNTFLANGPTQMGIQKGEFIQVLNQLPSGWTYGRKVPQGTEVLPEKDAAGWFPNWAIA